jgi:hypothetical protein
MLTFERVNELFSYDPDTGALTRKKNHWKAKKGDMVGSNNDGYLVVSIDDVVHRCHRVAWLLHTGSLPKNEIDHINGIRSDNRFENLRDATRSENAKNTKIHKTSTTGIKGVTWDKPSKKWRSMICCDNKLHYLGLFERVEDAMKCYEKAAIEMHGEFANLDSHRAAYRAAMDAIK